MKKDRTEDDSAAVFRILASPMRLAAAGKGRYARAASLWKPLGRFDSVDAKNDIEQSNCIEKQGNIIEEKGGMRKKWLRFALSSIC